jgi:uncharacterized membrane protein YeaQ/YmgE (transglycosylase-associated protein family)
MGLILTIILGGIAGWIASKIMRTDGEQGVLLNIVVGVIGAFLANAVLAPVLGVGAVLDRITVVGFLMAVLGAVVLLAIVNLFRKGQVR